MDFATVEKTYHPIRKGSHICNGELPYEVELPCGWFPVAYRVPRLNERYLDGNRICYCSHPERMRRSFLIICGG